MWTRGMGTQTWPGPSFLSDSFSPNPSHWKDGLGSPFFLKKKTRQCECKRHTACSVSCLLCVLGGGGDEGVTPVLGSDWGTFQDQDEGEGVTLDLTGVSPLART